MKQQTFERQHGELWLKVEAALDKPAKDDNSIDLSEQYLLMCHHLSLAKERHYDNAIVERLNKLVLRLYREVYRYKSESRFNFFSFFVRDFPLSIYRHRFYILVAGLLMVLPALIAGLWVYFDESAIYYVMDSSNVHSMEDMYDPQARKLGREREADTDIYMFGYYIQNNISVAFKCFAGGLLAGLGSILLLFFNGLMMGSVAGHLTRLDFVDTFYPFVVGHGSFELTAIVFSGAAGLRMGYSILNPKQYTRLNSLRIAGKEVITLLYGIIFMLVVAAFLEAFWSSSATLPVAVKYSVGGFLWLFVILYSCSGRRFESR